MPLIYSDVDTGGGIARKARRTTEARFSGVAAHAREFFRMPREKAKVRELLNMLTCHRASGRGRVAWSELHPLDSFCG